MGLVHLKAADQRVMPWKNGLGSTTEIAVSPRDAGVDAFEWRVSAAVVAADGPFSGFAGVDRTLSILSGEGLRLFVGNAQGVTLTQETAPFSFAADVPTTADLLGGRITDLNVMTRRGTWRHSVERLVVDGELSVSASAAVTLFYSPGGGVRVAGEGGDKDLGAGDAVRVDPGHWRLVAASATVYAISLDPASASR